jgi:hypothetical protein
MELRVGITQYHWVKRATVNVTRSYTNLDGGHTLHYGPIASSCRRIGTSRLSVFDESYCSIANCYAIQDSWYVTLQFIVSMATKSTETNELKILRHLVSRVSNRPGYARILHLLNSFTITGPNGTHNLNHQSS